MGYVGNREWFGYTPLTWIQIAEFYRKSVMKLHRMFVLGEVILWEYLQTLWRSVCEYCVCWRYQMVNKTQTLNTSVISSQLMFTLWCKHCKSKVKYRWEQRTEVIPQEQKGHISSLWMWVTPAVKTSKERTSIWRVKKFCFDMFYSRVKGTIHKKSKSVIKSHLCC